MAQYGFKWGHGDATCRAAERRPNPYKTLSLIQPPPTRLDQINFIGRRRKNMESEAAHSEERLQAGFDDRSVLSGIILVNRDRFRC